MAYGFENDKTKADFDQAINEVVAPLITRLNALQNKVNNFLETVYPVGSIYTSTSSANPGLLFGGTWERYAEGRTLVGVSSTAIAFMNANKTGGEIEQTIRIDYKHSHDVIRDGEPIYTEYVHGPSSPTHRYVLNPEVPATSADVEQGKFQFIPVNRVEDRLKVSEVGRATDTTVEINKLQPYITVYFWRRKA